MPCYHPLEAWQLDSGAIVFSERGSIRRALVLPCGQCIGCRLERSRQWALRCLHESRMHKQNCFVTLTYDEDHLPVDGGLRYRDFQLFCKRLRARDGAFRFYMCGEYGDRYGRPHFHACLFGRDFLDRRFFRRLSSGFPIFTSDSLARLWSLGYSSVGDVTFESAAYVARYITKKITGARADAHYRRVDVETGEVFQISPEFTHMSLKPGIGRSWIERYTGDVYPHDRVILRGRECRPPRYYDNYFRSVSPLEMESLDFEREQRALAFVNDSSPDRLVSREIVAKAKLKHLKRSLD